MRPVTVLWGCLVLAACTGAPGPAPETGATPTSAPVAGAVLSCAGSIGTGPPPATFETVPGVVALPTSPRSPALETSRSGTDGPRRLFAETGLLIRAGSAFDLVVPDQAGTAPDVGWGSGPAGQGRRAAAGAAVSGRSA